jgi:hypothetical protein
MMARSTTPAELDKSLFAGIICAKRVDNSATVTNRVSTVSADFLLRTTLCGSALYFAKNPALQFVQLIHAQSINSCL